MEDIEIIIVEVQPAGAVQQAKLCYLFPASYISTATCRSLSKQVSKNI